MSLKQQAELEEEHEVCCEALLKEVKKWILSL